MANHNEPQHPQEDDQHQNANNQQSGQAESRMHSRQSRLDNPLDESTDHILIYFSTQSSHIRKFVSLLIPESQQKR